MDELIGSRYRLVEKLGEGGMGTVYRAFDRLTHQEIALKRVITPGDDDGSFSQSEEGQSMLLSLAVEFRTLASLRHPHIISVLDYGFDRERHPYLTMELLHHARTITDALKDASLERKVQALNDLLLALDYLHRRDVIHRDLKPENVLVTPDGTVKVLDFGLALGRFGQSVTGVSDATVGTMAYIAPELFSDADASVQSDLYAFGLIAYEVFTGAFPFSLKNVMTLINNILNTTPDVSTLDPPLDALVSSLVAKSADDRPQSAMQVIQQVCDATGQPLPVESQSIRESYLQASAFVGRQAELARLREALRLTQAGHSSAFLVGGESGVGKSRLVDELRIRALARGVPVLRGQASAEGGLPYQMWREPVRRLLLSTDVSDLEASILKELVPDIGDLLGRDVPDAPELTGSAWQRRLGLALIDLFKRQIQPLVLILEDLQWAGLNLLKQLLQAQPPRLFILGTYRDDEQPTLPDDLPGVEVIHLKRLDKDATAALSQSMLGEAGAKPDMIEWLQHETEGNAFFMVEVVRALAEEAGRLSDVGRMALPQTIFTGGVQQIVRRRLERVPDWTREALKLSAVAGRQIDRAVLAQFPLREHGVEDFLTTCANVAVLAVADGEFQFAHDKLRETLLRDLRPAERPRLHRQVAQAIEAAHPGDRSYNEALLEHWHAAGEVDRATAYLTTVVERLVEVKAEYGHAQTLIERGLRDLPADDPRRILLLNWQARAHLQRGHNEQAYTLIEQALALARSADDRRGIAEALNNLGVMHNRQGNYGQAQTYHEQSLALRREIDDRPGIATSLSNLGLVAVNQGDYARGEQYLQQSLTLRREIGDQRGIAHSLNNLGVVAHDQGKLALSKDYNIQTLELLEAIGDQYSIALSLNNLGITALDEGNYDEAQRYFERSLTIRENIGDRYGIAITLDNLGYLAYRQGLYARSTAHYQRGIAIRRSIKDQGGLAISLNDLGFVYLRTGDDRAGATFREALAIAQSLQAAPIKLLVLTGIAGLHLHNGNAQRAAELIALARQHPATHTEVQDRVDELMPQLQAALPAETLAAAQARGAVLDLDDVVAAEL